MVNPSKQSYEPNPLMLGLAYFVTFITLVVLIALICTGELMKGRNSAAILCFALFVYLAIAETVKYRKCTRQRREETTAEDGALPASLECEDERPLQKKGSNWPRFLLLRPTYKTKQSLIVGCIFDLVLVAISSYYWLNSPYREGGPSLLDALFVALLVIPLYMCTVNIVHYRYTKRHQADESL